MLVHNNVVRDSRVLKTGDALALAGYAVDIVGLGETPKIVEQRSSGAIVEWITPTLDNYPGSALISFLIAVLDQMELRNRLVEVTFCCLVTLALIYIFGLAGLLGLVFMLLEMFLVKRSFFLGLVEGSLALSKKVLLKIGSLLRSKFRSDARCRAYLERAQQKKYDIIHCHDWVALPAAIKIVKKTSAKLVWDAHEIYQEVAQQKSAIVKKYIISLIGHAQGYVDVFITINDSIASFYATQYPKLPDAVVVKNSVLKPEITGPYDGRLHKAAGIPDTQKIILYQGGFAELRGLERIVDMAKYLDARYTVVFMGWGGIEEKLKLLGEEANSFRGKELPAIMFIPPADQAELLKWSAGATLGLILYENTGLNHLYCTPNKLWEYPAAGVPCLCSNLVEMNTVVKSFGIGWLACDSNDPRMLARQINELNDTDYQLAGRNCSTFISVDHWGVYSSRLIHAYSNLAG